MALGDYTARVLHAISALEVNDLRNRRDLYDRLRAEIAEESSDQDLLLSADEIDLKRRLLEFTIRRIETDLRAGVEIEAPDYQPSELRKFRANLETRAERIAVRAAATAGPVAPPLQPDDEDTVMQLSAALQAADEGSRYGNPQMAWPPRAVVWLALLLSRFHETAAASRIALIWVVVEPALLIGAIILGYTLLGSQYVLNMEVANFAVLGVVPWAFLRVVSTRVGGRIGTNTAMYGLPPVLPLDVGIAEGLLNLVIYTGVLLLALMAVIVLGLGQLPSNYLLCTLVWFALWANSVSIGFLLGSWFRHWPYARRVTPVFFRAFSMFSGLIFVTEQLPEDYRPYFLWNPFIHGLQLFRSAYFVDYQSEDASILYFGTWTVILILIALMTERRMRPDLVPR